MLQLHVFRVFHILCFLCVPLFPMLMYFFTFCMFSRVVCKFHCLYICVIPSFSFSVSLSTSTLLTSWFSEPRCQHFGKPFKLSSVLCCIFLLVFCRLRLVICINLFYLFIIRFNLPSSYGK